MTVSVHLARAVTVRHFAIAAIVGALSTLAATEVSTPGVAQGTGMAMPATCQQGQLDDCSLEVWAHDSFPKRGVTQSATFSNGVTLTCTSNGANRPRTCKLGDADSGPPRFVTVHTDEAKAALDNISHAPVPYKCAHLNQALQHLQAGADSVQQPVDHVRAYLKRLIQMTQPQLEAEIARQRLIREYDANSSELNFLVDLRANKFIGGGTSQQNWLARADRIVQDEQSNANAELRDENELVDDLKAQIKGLNCASVAPTP